MHIYLLPIPMYHLYISNPFCDWLKSELDTNIWFVHLGSIKCGGFFKLQRYMFTKTIEMCSWATNGNLFQNIDKTENISFLTKS